MTIDGKLIAHGLKSALKNRARDYSHRLKLGVIMVHETPEMRKFIEQKIRFGKEIGVDVEVIRSSVLQQKTENLLQLILHATKENDGLVLQLPLPHQFSLENVLNFFPLSHDVDVIGNTAFQQHKEGSLPFLPPVVGAIAEILDNQNIRVGGHKILVVGDGRLVGSPTQYWAKKLGAIVTTADKETENLSELTQAADVIVLGTGVPGLLKPDMVRDGVIILDAGTSETAGVLQGDADPACADKAMVFTPTPGGIGPITVAKLFENLFILDELKRKNVK